MTAIRSPYVLVPLALGTAVVCGLAFNGSVPLGPSAVAASSLLPEAASELANPTKPRAILAMCGLSPATLAAAGCDTNDASAVVAAARSVAEQYGQAIADAREAVLDARKALQSARSTGTTESVTLAQATLTEAEDSLSSVNLTAHETVTAPLSSTERAIIATIASNKGRDVPVSYLTVTRTDSEWVALRDALAIRKDFAAKSTTEPDTVTSLIASVESQTEVGQALAAAQNSLAGIEAAWTAALLAE
jgi:hypothetical protein